VASTASVQLEAKLQRQESLERDAKVQQSLTRILQQGMETEGM
jgi:hypothetical protein